MPPNVSRLQQQRIISHCWEQLGWSTPLLHGVLTPGPRLMEFSLSESWLVIMAEKKMHSKSHAGSRTSACKSHEVGPLSISLAKVTYTTKCDINGVEKDDPSLESASDYEHRRLSIFPMNFFSNSVSLDPITYRLKNEHFTGL